MKFQSTRPRGARHDLLRAPAHEKRFNPRARAGRDKSDPSVYWLRNVFQSTRPRGARQPVIRDWYRDQLVSIHAPARGATTSPARPAASSTCFNPRARAGRDSVALSIHDPIVLFQSTRPRGARPGADRQRGGRHRQVSIHAPARGATGTATVTATTTVGFNPRARAGRDLRFFRLIPREEHVSIHAPARGATPVLSSIVHELQVSIHAPARGATRHESPDERRGRVSIHAPARGATRACWGPSTRMNRFNPRARAGRDRTVGEPRDRPIQVSIHAPARGATIPAITPMNIVAWFQSTRPRGARRPRRWPGRTEAACFNPRARAGRDVKAGDAAVGIVLFQSTRPRGARPGGRRARSVLKRVSIHAPARGATARQQPQAHVEAGFNPRARAGRDLGRGRRAVDEIMFQSTRPRGARRRLWCRGYRRRPVSIHAPARGATSSSGR